MLLVPRAMPTPQAKIISMQDPAQRLFYEQFSYCIRRPLKASPPIKQSAPSRRGRRYGVACGCDQSSVINAYSRREPLTHRCFRCELKQQHLNFDLQVEVTTMGESRGQGRRECVADERVTGSLRFRKRHRPSSERYMSLRSLQ